jgi:glyoxylase-like metal-dependent hydrolase (beta-lactamase superfamily II)
MGTTAAKLRDVFVLLATIIMVQIPASAERLDPANIPVPPGAKGPAIPPEKGYLVEEIRDGIYWLTNGTYQSLFMITGQGVVVIDAPPLLGANILKAIGELTAEPITHVIYSHSHRDHIGAAGLLPKTAKFIAHEATKEILVNAGDPDRPIPTSTFKSQLTLTVGNKTLELMYPGENHSAGNIFIYAPAQKVLMLVDVVFPGWVPFAHLGMSDEVKGSIRALDQALEYDFDTLVAGHVTRLGTREDVETLKQYVADLRQGVEQARREVDFPGIVAATGGPEHPWNNYKGYYDFISRRCAELTVPKYLNVLADVASYTEANCFWIEMSDDME